MRYAIRNRQAPDYKDPGNAWVRAVVGILLLIGVLLIVLKATGVLTWSWWVVAAPIWIPVGVAGVIFILALYFPILED